MMSFCVLDSEGRMRSNIFCCWLDQFVCCDWCWSLVNISSPMSSFTEWRSSCCPASFDEGGKEMRVISI